MRNVSKALFATWFAALLWLSACGEDGPNDPTPAPTDHVCEAISTLAKAPTPPSARTVCLNAYDLGTVYWPGLVVGVKHCRNGCIKNSLGDQCASECLATAVRYNQTCKCYERCNSDGTWEGM